MSALELFTYAGHDVRVVEGVDGEPWFVLNDLCRVLEVANARNVAARLDRDMKGVRPVDTLGGRQNLTIVSEAGMYEVIIRSDKPSASAFRRWVTSEVLPSIRKTGSYTAAPRTYAEALRELAETVEARELAEQRAAQLEAPAAAWDVLVSAHGDYSVDEAAKILSREPGVNIGRNRLFTLMSRLGWIYRHGPRKTWHAYQAQVENGRLRMKANPAFQNQHTGQLEAAPPTIRVTAKGIQALHTHVTPEALGEIA